ncbi:DUF6221 family protein [Streptomyces albus]|uniref:DUF6221 family protein n=1 Tax=Streptomyces albus TaxID=1888 RepID=UPI0036FBC87D
MVTDLVAFLRARLDEDEALARSVRWDGSAASLEWQLRASAAVDVGGDEFYAGDCTVANHVVRHDPARVLTEVNAKCGVVALASQATEEAASEDFLLRVPAQAQLGVLKPVLRLLALPYADHPDYREEWRP